jgi:hypothetical protein
MSLEGNCISLMAFHEHRCGVMELNQLLISQSFDPIGTLSSFKEVCVLIFYVTSLVRNQAFYVPRNLIVQKHY